MLRNREGGTDFKNTFKSSQQNEVHGVPTILTVLGPCKSHAFQCLLSLPPLTPASPAPNFLHCVYGPRPTMLHATTLYCALWSSVKGRKASLHGEHCLSSAQISESKHWFLVTGRFLVHRGPCHIPTTFQTHKLQSHGYLYSTEDKLGLKLKPRFCEVQSLFLLAMLHMVYGASCPQVGKSERKDKAKRLKPMRKRQTITPMQLWCEPRSRETRDKARAKDAGSPSSTGSALTHPPL